MVEIESAEMRPAMISFESIDTDCLQNTCNYELGNCDQGGCCHDPGYVGVVVVCRY